MGERSVAAGRGRRAAAGSGGGAPSGRGSGDLVYRGTGGPSAARKQLSNRQRLEALGVPQSLAEPDAVLWRDEPSEDEKKQADAFSSGITDY